MRYSRHALAAANETHLGFTEQNLLRSIDYRLKPRTAQPVYRERRRLDSAPRLESHVSRKVDSVRGTLDHVTENDVVDLARPDLRPFEGCLRRNHAEVDRGDVA